MGGPRLAYFALRPMTIGAVSYAVGDVVDVSGMTNDTVTGLLRSGYLATSIAGDIRSAVVQAAEPTAPQVNDLWIDSDAVDRAHVSTSKSAAQSLTSGTLTVVTFDGEEFDTHGYHDTATNNSRLTVPAGHGGYFLMNAIVGFAASGTGVRTLYLNKNGANGSLGAFTYNNTGTSPTRFSGSHIVSLVDGDYLEIAVIQDSGGALDLEALSKLQLTRLGG